MDNRIFIDDGDNNDPLVETAENDGEYVDLYSNAAWWMDIYDMHDHYGFHEAIGKMDGEKLRQMLKFRIDFLQEELDELKSAESPEDVVDALVDLCVVAIGTLDAFNVDAQEAWDQVHLANMEKERGLNPTRPNPLGLPDLIKPKGWTPPSHVDNWGLFEDVDFTDFGKLFE